MSYGLADPAESLRMYERLTKGNWWTPRVGANRVRIMPPWSTEFKRWWFEWTLHWNIGERKAVIPCLKVHGVGDKRCAICEEIEKLKQANDLRVDPKTDHNILPSWNSQISLIDYASPGIGAQTYGAGITIMRGLLKWENNPDYGDITNPEKGYDVTIDKLENTPWYDTAPARNPTPLQDMSWLDNLPDLSESYTIWLYSEQVQWLRGEIPKRGDNRTNKQLVSASTRTQVAPGGIPQQAAPQQAALQQAVPQQAAPQQAVPQQAAPVKKAPRCFGSFLAGDPVCTHCKAWVAECERVKKEQDAKASNVAAEAIPVAGVPRPRCFGKEFSRNSPECQECNVKLDCAAVQ